MRVQAPFKSASEYLTFQRILEGRVAVPEHCSREARDLILGLLVSDPSQRIGAGLGLQGGRAVEARAGRARAAGARTREAAGQLPPRSGVLFLIPLTVQGGGSLNSDPALALCPAAAVPCRCPQALGT